MILELDEVAVSYGGVHAVRGVSLGLREGALHALVGPNGSGKTTLINAVSRLTHLSGGTITFDGADVSGLRPHQVYRRGLARTFQGIRLVEDLTVRENVALGFEGRTPEARWFRRGASGAALSAADEALDRLGIAGVAAERPGELPYGVQRRVEIARALAGDPRVLLLDEPVAGMGAAERVEIGETLRQLRADGMTLLLVEHDLAFVLGLADQLFVLDFGTLLASGDPHETAALPAVRTAFLGPEERRRDRSA
ncbi:ABC transporter ATP-binding protein [Pseudonocardia xishanensis]|uniref:ABC transporter domain-containing protein n=1 Tax=Pseudonocardia xishanensis TaxID=630995 RepID=A0ABP8RXC6_9PSEU